MITSDFDWFDVLTGKTSIDDLYMNTIKQEAEKIKPLLVANSSNTLYLNAISKILIAKGILTQEEVDTLWETALNEAQEMVEQQIADFCNETKDELSKTMSQKESKTND